MSEDMRLMSNGELLVESKNARSDVIDAQSDFDIHMDLRPYIDIQPTDEQVAMVQDWNDMYDSLLSYLERAKEYKAKVTREINRRDDLRRTKTQVTALGGKVTWLENVFLKRNLPKDQIAKSGRML